ncbi:MAG: hypothetical protein ACTSRZ_11455 [Promethearchaeota archaeon]
MSEEEQKSKEENKKEKSDKINSTELGNSKQIETVKEKSVELKEDEADKSKVDSDFFKDEQNNNESDYKIIKHQKKDSYDFEKSYENHMDEASADQISEEKEEIKSLYAYCRRCNDYVFIKYRKSLITNASSFPVFICWIHGNPVHGIVVRIDRNFVSRGERVVELEFDPNILPS